jgi:hypothetical protein
MTKHIKDIVARLKNLWRIAGSYDSDLDGTYNSIAFLAKTLKDRTDVGVDMGCDDRNYAIVVGRYKDVDYIQTFELRRREFTDAVDLLREMKKYGNVRTVDAPPMFRAVVNHFKEEL